MNVYVETNFVLELALLQEQHASCTALIQLAEANRIQLIMPAYAMAEPYETLTRRHRQRQRMRTALDAELRQLARMATYAERLRDFQYLTTVLVESADEETARLERVCTQLLQVAEIVPLTAMLWAAAMQHQHTSELSAQDALVYAAVLEHLQQASTAPSCFLNRNSKDFDDPDLVAELQRYGCKLLPQFEAGYQFVLSCLP